MWEIGTKLFKHLATFAKLFDIVEGFGRTEQCLFCRIEAKVRVAGISKRSVKLLGFKKGKRSVALDDLNFLRGSSLVEGIRVPISIIN